MLLAICPDSTRFRSVSRLSGFLIISLYVNFVCLFALVYSLESITADMSGLNILSDLFEANRFMNSEINIKVCFLQEESEMLSSNSESVSILAERSLVLSDTFEAVSAGLAGAESKSSDFDI